MRQKFDETRMDSPELMEYGFKRELIIPSLAASECISLQGLILNVNINGLLD